MSRGTVPSGPLAFGLLIALAGISLASRAVFAQQGETQPERLPFAILTPAAAAGASSAAKPSPTASPPTTALPPMLSLSPASPQGAIPPTLVPPPPDYPSAGEAGLGANSPELASSVVPAPASGWSVPVNVSNSATLSDWPAIAVGTDGSLFAVWAEGSLGSREIYYATNAGGLWSIPANLSLSPSIDSNAPDIAADPLGGANIVWQEGTYGDTSIEVKYTRCVGTSCSASPVNVSSGRCGPYTGNWHAWMPSIVVGDDGMAMVTWASFEPGANYLPTIVWQPPNSVPTQITNCTPYAGVLWMPDLAAGPSGQRRLVFEYFQAGTISHGRYAAGSWGTARFVANGSTPRVIVDGGALSHIIWCRAGTVDYVSGDGLSAWPALEVIAADQDCGGPPTVAIRWDGLVQAIWEGRAHGVQVLQSVRTQAGWSLAENISQSAANGEDPALIAESDGTLHVLWADSRGGNFDIFNSEREPPHTVVMQGQGFDIVSAPSPDDLAAWWNAPSPYRYVGVYYGGSTRWDQKQLELNEEGWFAEVARQGWRFIPIWAGPMRPCRHEGNPAYDHFDNDPLLAEQDGREQAQLAVEEAYRFGLVGPSKTGTVIYYDFEPPDSGKECTTALQRFVTGWVTELNLLGNTAGVYAIAEDVMSLTDFDGVEPNAMWIANYYAPPNRYHDDASVWDITHNAVPTTVWNDHNRLRQYAGTHTEPPYGGVNLKSIDSNIADGPLAVVPGVTPMAQPPRRSPRALPVCPRPRATAGSKECSSSTRATVGYGQRIACCGHTPAG